MPPNRVRIGIFIHCLWFLSSLSTSLGDDEKEGFQPGYLPEVNLHKAAEILTPKQCAGSTIIHMKVGQCTAPIEQDLQVYVVPHAAIMHDGVTCGTGSGKDYMIVVPSDLIGDAKTANLNGLGPLYGVLSSNTRARNAFRVLKGVDKLLVGFEYNGPRVCGNDVAYGQNTIFMFLIPPPRGRDLNFGFAYLGVLEVGMVSIRTDEELCLYKESRRLGPGQKPFSTPTPTPSPGSHTDLPPEVMLLDEVAALPACFPAKFVDSLAKPSPSPSPSKRIPKPTPSPSASNESTAKPTASVPAATASASLDPSAQESSSPSPSPSNSFGANQSQTSSPVNVSICFPSDATVELETGVHVAISTLQIGDKVLVAKETYSEVFMFSHHVTGPVSTFIKLTVKSNRSITLSPKHYIPVNDRLTAADAVRVGDVVLLGSGETDEISSTQQVVLSGLHNPQTTDGRIVVNGIVASTFTQHVDPPVALALLAPVKLLHRCNLFRNFFSNLFKNGNSFLAIVLPNGLAVSYEL